MSEPVPIRGVILAAGYGTRFLPATKTVPKEMLPIVDVPSIQLVVDEFIASGIRDVLVITSRRKKALEDYFDRDAELESVFHREEAGGKLARIAPPPVNVSFVRQQEMRGTAHALMLCEGFAGRSPFVVAYPDDLMPEPPCARQLIETWQETVSPERPHGCCVLSVLDMPGQDVSRYGVVDPELRDGQMFVLRMVEKPSPGAEPSRLVSLGRYLYTPDIFPVLHELAAQPRLGEFYQTEPINTLAVRGLVVARAYGGRRYDTGEPIGYVKTIVELALARSDLRDELTEFLKDLWSKRTER
jgi:UTP--glucose-1-phosphate uridylyltransferase